MLPLYILYLCESAAKHLMLGPLVSKVSSWKEELNTKQKRIRTLQIPLGISFFFFFSFSIFIYLFTFFVRHVYFFLFYFIFKLYNIALVLPNIEMNPPQVISAYLKKVIVTILLSLSKIS